MSPKKNRYSSSISTSWIIPPVASRPTSVETFEKASIDTPNSQNTGGRESPSNSGKSRSKYTSSFPLSWTLHAGPLKPPVESKGVVHETPSKNDNQNGSNDSNVTKSKPSAPLKVEPWLTDRDFSITSTPARAPVEERFPQNRQKFSDGSLPPPPKSTNSRTATDLSSTCSPTGSCDLPVAVPSISPAYSAV